MNADPWYKGFIWLMLVATVMLIVAIMAAAGVSE